ncbi:hypothetical protein ACWD3J_45345 [Streptomyces sp. NPDC002755]|uniref:hypothetical protein n=1 Tax=Streptomyces sp. NPDC002884 TaxID=3154544 RepID=UPI00332EAFF7
MLEQPERDENEIAAQMAMLVVDWHAKGKEVSKEIYAPDHLLRKIAAIAENILRSDAGVDTAKPANRSRFLRRFVAVKPPDRLPIDERVVAEWRAQSVLAKADARVMDARRKFDESYQGALQAKRDTQVQIDSSVQSMRDRIPADKQNNRQIKEQASVAEAIYKSAVGAAQKEFEEKVVSVFELRGVAGFAYSESVKDNRLGLVSEYSHAAEEIQSAASGSVISADRGVEALSAETEKLIQAEEVARAEYGEAISRVLRSPGSGVALAASWQISGISRPLNNGASSSAATFTPPRAINNHRSQGSSTQRRV